MEQRFCIFFCIFNGCKVLPCATCSDVSGPLTGQVQELCKNGTHSSTTRRGRFWQWYQFSSPRNTRGIFPSWVLRSSLSHGYSRLQFRLERVNVYKVQTNRGKPSETACLNLFDIFCNNLTPVQDRLQTIAPPNLKRIKLVSFFRTHAPFSAA